MWLMLQQPEPDDYVVATGVATKVRDFIVMAFKEAGIGLIWEGKGVEEKGINQADGRILVEIDPRYFRPAEVDMLVGDPSKAKVKLGWEPNVKLPELVKMMVEHDIKLARREVHLKAGGYKIENYYE